MKAKLLFVSILICLFACDPSRLDTGEALTRFVSSSKNLTKSSEVNGHKVTVAYRPTDLIVSQEIGDVPVNNNVIDSLRRKYSQYHYFLLQLSRNGIEALRPDLPEYGDVIQTLSFRMNHYVNLTTLSDTIPVSDFSFDRTFGRSASTDVLFVFDKKDIKETEWVQFNLNEFGLPELHDMSFRFKIKDLANSPQIRFNGS